MIDSLKSHFSRLLEMNDCALIEFNGEHDHVHLLIELHPSIEPAKLINNLKTVSSRMLKKEFGDHLKRYYWGTNALWNRSYCLLSVGGAPIEVLKQYISNQKKPDWYAIHPTLNHRFKMGITRFPVKTEIEAVRALQRTYSVLARPQPAQLSGASMTVWGKAKPCWTGR